MEKLLEFKKGKTFDENSRFYRFQCDCLDPPDAMDIEVMSDGIDDEGKYFVVTMNFYGTGLWNRIQYAWQILRGMWAWREFVVRKEDCANLSMIFNPNRKFEELP